MKFKPAKVLVASLCATSLLSGCVTNGGNANFLSTTPGANGECDYNEAAYVIGGAVVGIGLGLLLGGDNKGIATVAGGAAGGALGKGLQSYLQSRCQELAAVQKRMKESELNVQAITAPASGSWVNPDDTQKEDGEQGIAVTVSNTAMFETGSSKPTVSAADDLQELAKTYANKNRKVLIVGHTDATGPDAFNRKLSEQRARAVAKIFSSAGVSTADLYYKGAGADRPVATNQTPEGRAINRRVEVVELETEKGIIAYDSFVESDPNLPARVAASLEIPETPPAPPKSQPTQKPSDEGQVTSKTTTSSPTQLPKTLKVGSSIDFGGQSIADYDQNLAEQIEKKEQDDSFIASLWPISDAQASSEDPMLGTTCINDTYRPVGEVMSLDDDKPIHSTSDYVPGLYSTSWHDQVNGHLVGLTHVAVLKDSGLTNKQPTFFVFENYQKGDQDPTLSASASARSYAGKNGVIYRVFLDETVWPARCVDVFFPKGSAQDKTADARIYYDKNEQVFANAMTLKIAKSTEQ
ncbi:OmpA family protein [Thalassospira lucentensis]|uniref:OmpA family protein n=1 Tax=Thalassospira lucentensis TaxID=168935 RepID=UPI00399D5902